MSSTPLTVVTASAEETRAFGRALGQHLRAGDLIMLSGNLGAGKTTFTQGIGAGLGVRGRVSSPTFIVARTHPNLAGGPDLIHVDAYRVDSLEDLETLDLDSSLDQSVTVVEWGEGKTEGLSPQRLEITLVRAQGASSQNPDDVFGDATGDEERRIELRPHGSRWDAVLERVIADAASLTAAGAAGDEV